MNLRHLYNENGRNQGSREVNWKEKAAVSAEPRSLAQSTTLPARTKVLLNLKAYDKLVQIL